MPTTRMRRARVWSAELDPHRREALLEGPRAVLIACAAYHKASCQTLPEMPEDEWQAGLAEMRRDWEVHHVTLLAAYRVEHGADAKPWAWWRFDASPAQRAEHIAKHGERG